MERHGDMLVLRLANGQQLNLQYYFYSADCQIESFEFADGTTWDAAEVTAIGDGLIDAMAAFGPGYQAAGSSTITAQNPQPIVLAPTV